MPGPETVKVRDLVGRVVRIVYHNDEVAAVLSGRCWKLSEDPGAMVWIGEHGIAGDLDCRASGESTNDFVCRRYPAHAPESGK